MSEAKREKGMLKILSRNKDEFESIARYVLSARGIHHESDEDYTILEYIQDEFYDDYIITDKFFAEITDYKELDSDFYFCDIQKFDENTYSFHTMYYNGGTCMSEMIASEMDKFL